MKYELQKELKEHLKGFTYQVEHLQDNLLLVYVDVEKTYLPAYWLNNPYIENANIWAKENNIRVTFYTEGLKK